MKDLFRPGPFEYRMGLSKGKAEDFFKHDPEDEIVLKERKRILSEHPERHCELLDEGRDSLEEFNELLVHWGIIPSSLSLKKLGEPGVSTKEIRRRASPQNKTFLQTKNDTQRGPETA